MPMVKPRIRSSLTLCLGLLLIAISTLGLVYYLISSNSKRIESIIEKSEITTKENYAPTENLEFVLEIDEKLIKLTSLKNVSSSAYAQSESVYSSNDLTITPHIVNASTNEEYEVPISIEVENDTKFLINVEAQDDKLVPGLYELQIDVEKGRVKKTVTEDFTWGVLAINTNKSIYLPGDEAQFGIAVLNNEGYMVCGARVVLEIQKPDGESVFFSTDDGSINVNPGCNKFEMILEPDFEARYTVDEIGEYKMILSAETSAGTRTIADYFLVKDSVPFEVERYTATRIYPPEDYPVTFTIKANQDFVGEFIEQVPSSFHVPLSNYYKRSDDDTEIVWNVNWTKGNTYELQYFYNAPNQSPALHFLGPAKFLNTKGDTVFQENRPWQIASDATSQTTYDFVGVTTSTNDYFAYEKSGSTSFTGPNDTGDSEATNTDYDNIESDNASRWSTGGASTEGHYDAQLYKFYIDEPEAKITELDFKWNGYGETGQPGHTTTLYAYDYSSTQWDQLDTHDFISTTDVDLTFTESASPGQYIDTDGEVVIMVQTEKDATSPTVSATAPSNGATGIARGQNVIVRFSERMDTSVTPTLTQTAGTNPGGWSFQGWSTTTNTNDTATWSHNNWTYSDNITMQVSSYDDLAGLTGTAYSWSFSIRATSCPYVYSWDGEKYVYETDIFPDSPAKTIAKPSYDTLKHLVPDDNMYKFKLTQELKELSWIERLKLIAVDHPPGTQVYKDEKGETHTLDQLLSPKSCIDKDGKDCTDLLITTDDKYWDGDLINRDFSIDENLEDWIELEYDLPENIKELKVVTDYQKTSFFHYAITEKVLAPLGNSKLIWWIFDNTFFGKFVGNYYIDKFGHPKIQIYNGEEWVEVGKFPLSGTSGDRRNLTVIDFSQAKGNKIRVNTYIGTMKFNSMYVDYSDDKEVIETESLPDMKILSDEEYLFMQEGDEYTINYPEIPKRDGWDRSYIIIGEGYYRPDYRSGITEVEGFIQGIRQIGTFLLNPDYFPRTYKDEYLEKYVTGKKPDVKVEKPKKPRYVDPAKDPKLDESVDQHRSLNTDYVELKVTYTSITISGTCKQADQSTDCTDTGTIKVAVEGDVQNQEQVTFDGTWSITDVVIPDSNDTITVWIDGAGEGDEAVAVTVYDGTDDITGIELIEQRITIGDSDNRTVTNSNLGEYDNAQSGDEDIFHDVSAGNDLTIDCASKTSCELYVKTGNTYRPSGNVTTNDFEINGTLDADGNTITITGDGTPLDVNGTLDEDTSTIKYTSTSATNITAETYYHLHLQPSSSGDPTYTLPLGTLNTRDLIIGDGTNAVTVNWDSNDTTINVNGNLTFNDNSTWTKSPTATLTFSSGANPATWTDNNSTRQNVGNVTIDGAKEVDLGSNVVVTDLNITAGDTLDVVSGQDYQINISGSWTNDGTFSAQDGTVVFDGASNTTLDSGCSDEDTCTNEDFNILRIEKSEDASVTLSNTPLRVGDQIYVLTGIFSQGSQNVRAEGTTALEIKDFGRYRSLSTGDLTLGGNVLNDGEITINANGISCGDPDSITITSTNTSNRTWSGKGGFRITDVTASYQTGAAIIYAADSTDGGNNTGSWNFSPCLDLNLEGLDFEGVTVD